MMSGTRGSTAGSGWSASRKWPNSSPYAVTTLTVLPASGAPTPNVATITFVPSSCKGFYLCPSCSQKRTLLLSEYLSKRLLLRLPHRQFVFSFPKALRVFFKYNRRLFCAVSRLLFAIVQSFYNEAAGNKVRTAAVIAYQSSGDLLRFNPHFHALILEGGFDAAGRFIFIPLGDLARMTQYLRRRVLKLFLNKRLISRSFAENLLRWRHSGFSIDHSVRLDAHDQQARWALSQYIARPPLSLKKLLLDGIGAKVLLKSAYNPYFKENLKWLSATEFIGELTQHLPPHRMRCIRYYGLYSSRSRGKWHLWSHVAAHAPEGWKHREPLPWCHSSHRAGLGHPYLFNVGAFDQASL